MGTFAEFYGNVNIPQEKLPELTQRMMKLLEQGGIMEHESVSLFGKNLTLLSPLQLDKEGRAVFNYNYFDDDFWEYAAYNSNTGRISSNKIGYTLFADVVLSAYILMEYYSEEFGLVTVNDSLLPGLWKVSGVLNDLFDENYSDTRLMDAWKVYRLLKECDEYDTFEGVDPLRCAAWAPWSAQHMMLGTIRYLTVVHTALVRRMAGKNLDIDRFDELNQGDSSVDRGKLARLTDINSGQAIDDYLSQTTSQKLREVWEHFRQSEWKDVYLKNQDGQPMWVSFCGLTELCASSLERLRASAAESQEQQMAILKQILSDHERFYPSWDSPLIAFWFASYLLPKESTVKLMADIYEMDFWELLKELEDSVEEISEVWSAPFLKALGTPFPIEKIPFSQFLRFDRLGLSDDDRAYFWEPDGKIRFSDEMLQWLAELRKELLEIQREDGVLIEEREFIKTLMETLDEANNTYFRIYFFRDVFYEFLTHANQRSVQSAVILLKRLIERYRKEFSKEEKNGMLWGMGGCAEFHPARLKIKRYLAVLANPALRKLHFGF